jgi:hypothetical protein
MKFSKIKKALILAVILAIPTIATAQLLTANRLDRSIWLLDNMAAFFGTRPDTALTYNTAQTNDALMLGLSTDSRSFHIADYADVNFNFATANQTDPALYIHSHNQSTTEYMKLSHDGTNGRISVGTGAVGFDNGILSTTIYASGDMTFEGSTADAFETTLTVVDPTADRTVTLPNATGTVAIGGNVSLVAGANTACNTTCGSSAKCVAGQDSATFALVACATATADQCLCVGQ